MRYELELDQAEGRRRDGRPEEDVLDRDGPEELLVPPDADERRRCADEPRAAEELLTEAEVVLCRFSSAGRVHGQHVGTLVGNTLGWVARLGEREKHHTSVEREARSKRYL